jgi:hypothetical protein
VGAESDPSDIRICFIGDSLFNGVGDPEYLWDQRHPVHRWTAASLLLEIS